MNRAAFLALVLLSPATFFTTSCSLEKSFVERSNEKLDRAEKREKSEINTPQPIDEKIAKIWEADPRYRIVVHQRARKLPRVLSSPPLTYPIDPRVSGQTAAVIVTIMVNETGKVEEAKLVMSSNKRFDSHSLDLAKEIRFTPTGPAPAIYFFRVPMIYLGAGSSMTQKSEEEMKSEELNASASKLPKPKAGGATVTVFFTVEESGKVSSAKVEKSSDSRFNNAALESVRDKKFPALPKGSGSRQARLKVSFQ